MYMLYLQDLSKTFNFPGPQFLELQNGNNAFFTNTNQVRYAGEDVR